MTGELKNKNNIIYYVLVAMNILVIGMLFYGCFNNSIWKDEVFQLRMIDHPYSYFMLERRDAAPPFHFAYLKTLVAIIRYVMPNLSIIRAAKLSSFFIYITVFVVSNTIIKKRFGAVEGMMCSLLCMAMPHLLPLGLELRMYALSVLISFLWYIVFLKYLESEKIKYAVIIAILGPLGVFTHYYIVVGVIYAYAIYFFFCIVHKKYKNALAIVWVSVASSILYMPWIFIAFKSLFKAAKSFWISNETKASIIYEFFYPLIPDTNKYGIGTMISIIMVVITIYLILQLCRKEINPTRVWLFIGLTMPFIVALMGICIRLVLPVFQPRYTMVIMGCFWISVAVSVGSIEKKNIFYYTIIGLFIVVATLNLAKNTKEEIQYAHNIGVLEELLKTAEGDYIADDYRVAYCLPLYTNSNIIQLEAEDDIIQKVKQSIDKSGEAYLFNSDMSRIDSSYLDELANEGVTLEFVEHCGIEYVDIDVFRLSMKTNLK